MLEKPVQEKLLSIAKQIDAISKEHQISVRINVTKYEWDTPKISVIRAIESNYDCLKPTRADWHDEDPIIVDDVKVEFRSFKIVNTDETETDVA